MNQETAQKRKKVLFVVTKSNFGGAQRYVLDLASNLPQHAYDAVVVAGPAQGSSHPGELFERLKRAGIRTIFVPQMARDVSVADWTTARALYRIIKEERPDVVHINSSKAGGLGALVATLRRVPRIIFTVHGWAFRESRNPLSRLLIYIFSALTIMLSHRVICITAYDQRAFARVPLLRSKLHLVHSGTRGPQQQKTRAEARAALTGDAAHHANDIWVGSVGELTYNKNIKTALDAVAASRRSGARLYYVVVGDGEQRQQLKHYAHRREMGPYVHFAGYVPDASSLLAAFDILLLPSRKEGLPYVLIEAAGARMAVVASTAGGIPELVENGVSGALCAPDDTVGMADALSELATDPALRELFGAALHEKVAREHDFEKMLSKTTALYH